MRVLAGMGPRLPVAQVGTYAARVERLGYDGLHIAEMIHDPFVASALALDATTTLGVRTSMALAFVRSPMATAMSSWELAHLSGGRFDLGLGSQVRANIEERYGMAFDRPVARLRDHVLAVRACFEAFASGEPLDHRGPFHRLTRLQPDFRPAPLGDGVRRPEVWMGAVGSQMVRLAGELADGVVTHPTNSHPADLAARLVPALEDGARRTDRPTPPLVVSPMVVTGADPTALEASREAIRQRLAFLYSTPAYAPTLERLGLGAVGPSLRRLVRDEAWDRLVDHLPDQVLDQLVLVGTWNEIPSLVHDRYGRWADGIVLRPPEDPAADAAFAAVITRLRET